MKHFDLSIAASRAITVSVRPDWRYRYAKRAFDIVVSLSLLPLFILLTSCLLLLNPLCNRGPVFFVQKRMGRHCRPFTVLKFRTMRQADHPLRRYDEPLDQNRITCLGHLLRRTRIDELPQIVNVLRGDMSLIGPRPDDYTHATAYLTRVPGYAARHTVLPGISGYAQIKVGYIDCIDSVQHKVEADLAYIRTASLRLECWIMARTLITILRMQGR